MASTTDAGAAVPFYKRPYYKWAIVAMLWWMCFFNYADRQAIFSMKKLVSGEMGLDLVQWGWVGTSFALVYGLFAPFAGNVGDRFRRKSVILFGLYVWSIICALTALSRRFWHLMLFRAAEGMGETFYFPATTSLISDYHGRQTRSRALGIHNTGVYVGTVAGGALGGLIAQMLGWRSSFIIFGSLGVVLGLALAKLIAEPRRGAAEAAEMGVADDGSKAQARGVRDAAQASPPVRPAIVTTLLALLVYAACLAAWAPVALKAGRLSADLFGEGGRATGIVLGALPGIAVGVIASTYINYGKAGFGILRWIFGTPTVLVLMLVFMGANFVALVALSWLPAFLNEKFQLDLAKAGWWATAPINGATILGAALGGFLADLLRRRTPGGRMIVQALALFLGAPFVFLSGATLGLGVLIGALACWGLFKGMYDANIFASAFDVVPPHMRGTAAGFMNMAGWLGGAPGPVIIGWIAQQQSLSVAIASASAVYVAAGVLMLIGVAAFAKRDAARMERALLAAQD